MFESVSFKTIGKEPLVREGTTTLNEESDLLVISTSVPSTVALETEVKLVPETVTVVLFRPVLGEIPVTIGGSV